MNYIIKIQVYYRQIGVLICPSITIPVSSNEESNDEDDVYLYSFRTHFFIASSVWASEAR